MNVHLFSAAAGAIQFRQLVTNSRVASATLIIHPTNRFEAFGVIFVTTDAGPYQDHRRTCTGHVHVHQTGLRRQLLLHKVRNITADRTASVLSGMAGGSAAPLQASRCVSRFSSR